MRYHWSVSHLGPSHVFIEPSVDDPGMHAVDQDRLAFGLQLGVEVLCEHDLGRLGVAIGSLGGVRLSEMTSLH